MNRTIIAIVYLAIAATAASGETESRSRNYVNADLPPLLEFVDGTPVRNLDDWSRRREEIRQLMCKYFVGTFPKEVPAIVKTEALDETKGDDGSVRRRVKITFDTPNKASFEMWVWLPQGAGPFPLLLTMPRYYQIGWAEHALSRGYMVCLYPGVDSNHREEDYPGYDSVWQEFRKEYPKATWTEISTKGWIASRALDYLLDSRYGYPVAKGQVGIIGHSRYGKQALIAAAFDERITSVVARSSGSPGACPYRFTSNSTFHETPEGFPGEWFLRSLVPYTGREHELPIDAHGWLGLIAPRRCCLHVALHDDGGPTFAAERAYREGKKVYELLGKPENLHLNYRDGGHNPITDQHRRRNVDWFDLSFGRGTAKQSDFPEVLLHQFDWEAWKTLQSPENMRNPFPRSVANDDNDRVRRILWMLGRAPEPADTSGRYSFYREEEESLFPHDALASPNTARIPVSFGENAHGSVYYNPTVKEPVAAVIWLHPYNHSKGYTSGYEAHIPWGRASGRTLYHYLASKGFVVLAFDQLGFGPRLLEGPDFDVRNPGWSRMGRMVRDVRAAADFLIDGKGASKNPMPKVRTDQVFVLGYSLGGMVGLYATALDPRIAGAASFCGITPMRTDTDEKQTGGIRRLWQWYALIPKLGLFDGRQDEIPYDYEDVLALIAPRPCLLVTPSHDREADLDDLRVCVTASRKAWQSKGQTSALMHVEPDDINRFQGPQHDMALEWLEEVTGRTAAAVPVPQDWIGVGEVKKSSGLRVDSEKSHLSHIGDGHWACFGPYRFGDAEHRAMEVQISVPDAHAGQKMHVRLGFPNGPTVGTLNIKSTGSWLNFQTQRLELTGLNGSGKLFLVFEGTYGICNLKAFKLSKK